MPHLVPPTTPSIVFPTFIVLTCGQDIFLPSLARVTSLTIQFQCQLYNGTDLDLITRVFKDGILISHFPLLIHQADDDDFGTYTFVVSSEACGHAFAVSRILRQG